MPVNGQPGGPAIFEHVVPSQLRDPADKHPEEQDERSPNPEVQGHDLVGEAAVELMDVVVLSEQALWFLARGERHAQIIG